jgi:hypothetical protein
LQKKGIAGAMMAGTESLTIKATAYSVLDRDIFERLVSDEEGRKGAQPVENWHTSLRPNERAAFREVLAAIDEAGGSLDLKDIRRIFRQHPEYDKNGIPNGTSISDGRFSSVLNVFTQEGAMKKN